MALYQEQRDNENRLSGYKRTTDGANIPLAGGNTDHHAVLKWLDAGNAPDPDPNILGTIKQDKKAEYKTEAVRRIGVQVPEWDTYEIVMYTVSIANLLNIGSMNAAQTKAKDIYLYAKNTAIPSINGMTIPELIALDIPNDPNWPV